MNKRFLLALVLTALMATGAVLMYGCGKSDAPAKFTIVGSGS
jgi:hypothetical protein